MLNSAMHEIYLEMPMDAEMLPALESLPHWARLVHEMMYDLNPKMIVELSKKGELKSYLLQQHEKLTADSLELQRQWRQRNPLPKEKANQHLERASWINHSKLVAREMLIEDLRKSMTLLAEES